MFSFSHWFYFCLFSHHGAIVWPEGAGWHDVDRNPVCLHTCCHMHPDIKVWLAQFPRTQFWFITSTHANLNVVLLHIFLKTMTKCWNITTLCNIYVRQMYFFTLHSTYILSFAISILRIYFSHIETITFLLKTLKQIMKTIWYFLSFYRYQTDPSEESSSNLEPLTVPGILFPPSQATARTSKNVSVSAVLVSK